jgi:uncharacterized membrane protein
VEDKFKYSFFSKNRVEVFSDGIFAIIVTLLILEIKVPHISSPESLPELFRALLDLLPKFISWVISFMTLCIVWVNHHRLFEMFKGVNIVLFWLNVNILLWVCFIPFPTALVGDYPHNPLAVASYGIVMFFAGVAFILARLYGLKNKELLNESVSPVAYKKMVLFSFIFGPVSYLFAALLAWVNTYLSFVMYFLIAVYFMFSFAIHDRES